MKQVICKFYSKLDDLFTRRTSAVIAESCFYSGKINSLFCFLLFISNGISSPYALFNPEIGFICICLI